MLPTDLLRHIYPHVRAVLAYAATVAQAQSTRLWLVGGVVRDLLIAEPITRDLDLVVEGDAIALAHTLAAGLNGTVVASHEPFGTATLAVLPHLVPPVRAMYLPDAPPAPPLNDMLYLDLAMARIETYPHPAALPVVQPATIAEDLARRDFSINALALEVVADGSDIHDGMLLDPFNGRHDLISRVLRVLHDASFRDDPTRMLRGIRLSARLQGVFHPHTLELLNEALAQGYVAATSPERLRTELCLALAELQPDRVLHHAAALGMLPHLGLPLRWSAAIQQRCVQARARELPADTQHLIYAGLLSYDLTGDEREAIISHYRLPKDATQVLRDVPRVQAVRDRLAEPDIRNSTLDDLLRPFNDTALNVVAVAEGGNIANVIQYYQHALQPLTTLLNGNDIQRLGVAPGPHIGAMLRQLRAARLDGLVESLEDEEAWVRGHLRRMKSEG